MRLADSFVTARHPDDILRYKHSNKAILEGLDPDVIASLGPPLTVDKIEMIAKKDSLPLIYTDRIVQAPGRPTTRSLTKRRQTLDNAYTVTDPNYEDVEDEDTGANNFSYPERRVKFDLPDADNVISQ